MKTMKKFSTLLWALIALLGIGSLASCNSDDDSGDWIVDWAPVQMYITVKDMYGNDLLDTLSNSSVTDVMTITYQGETYHVRKDYDEQTGYSELTRMYLPRWYGFCLVNQWLVWSGSSWEWQKTDNFMIYVGEIDGAKDMDEDIVLSFPNGVTHTIHYHCSDHKEGRNSSCNRYYMLDGKRLDSNKIEIVL